MNEVQNTRISLGVGAGLIAGILAAVLSVVCLAPASAHAAVQGNYGGLVFDYQNAPGITTSTISINDTSGVVTVDGGNADYIVTEETLGTVTKATGIQTTGTFTGSITLNGVKLTVPAGTSQNAINFQNVNATGEGCEIILGAGTVVQGSGSQAAVNMALATANTLTITNGAQIHGEVVDAATGDVTSAQAISVAATVSSVIQFNDGGGTVTGGQSGTVGAIDISGAITSATEDVIDIVVDATASVNGTQTISGSTYTPTPAFTIQDSANSDNVIFSGSSAITLQGGSGNGSTPTAGAPAFNLNDGIIELGEYRTPGCSMIVYGGNGADARSDVSIASSTGGHGIVLNATSNGSPSFVVNSGSLAVTGGVGGAAFNNGPTPTVTHTTGANGGDGVHYTGTSGKAGVIVNGGSVQFAGGNGGAPTSAVNAGGTAGTQGQGGNGVVGTTNSGIDLFVVQYDPTSGATEAPVVTALAGNGGTGVAISNVDNNNAGVAADLTAKDYTNLAAVTDIKKAPNFLWVAYDNNSTGNSAPTAEALGKLDGFAGMDTPTDVGKNITGGWARIQSAPIVSLEAGLRYSSQAGTRADQPAPFVVAQTVKTMSGLLPELQWTYTNSIAATFEGVENVSTSNFSALATGSVDLGDTTGTVTPAENLSTTGVASGNFYVVETASGNTLNVAPGAGAGISGDLAELYPELTSISDSTVPVVYTINILNDKYPSTGITTNYVYPTTVYTDQLGNGTLVTTTDVSTGRPGGPADQMNQPGRKTITAPDLNNVPSATFIGLFDETTSPYTLVNNNQVNGWDSNAVLTAEWANMTLTSVAPSPTTLNQGNSIELTGTYTMKPYNNKITTYGLVDAGIDLGWTGIFVADRNVGSGYGDLTANGLAVEQTGGNTADVSDDGTFTVTSVATLSANGTANLGHYRIWPVYDNNMGTGIDPIPAGAQYAAVQVLAGSAVPEGNITVVRMYNPFTLEHLYTTDANEVTTLDNLGWDNEGEAWIAPAMSSTPIFRLYNPWNSDHMYTISVEEYMTLQTAGWRGEGPKLYSAPNTEVPVYRLYNEYMTENGGAFSHLWTGDYNEYVTLGGMGWKQESVAWYGLTVPEPL